MGIESDGVHAGETGPGGSAGPRTRTALVDGSAAPPPRRSARSPPDGSDTASDNVGVQKVELSLDGITWIATTGTTAWSGTLTLADGANTITARATDTSGNVATTSVHVTVQLSQGASALPPWLWILVVVAIVAVAAVAFLLWWRRRALPDSLLPNR